jgi:esterase/lipase superfamily enzyme
MVPILLSAVLFGGFLQVSTQRVLEHAEAFQYRRMLVTQEGEGDVYRFFFVTNRRFAAEGDDEEGEAALESRYSSERSGTLRFGHFDTEIEPSLGIGMLVNPTDWFRNEEIRLREVVELENRTFIEALRSQVQASPERSLLINVNGFRERFPSALRKTAFLAHVLDVDSPMLVFDWPGDQGSTPNGYRRAQSAARESGAELASTIRLIVEEVGPERLWLVANSMGAEVVVSAFEELHRDSSFSDAETEFEEVVLTAPDVSYAGFGAQFRDEISAIARNLTVYVSSNDRALLMSRVINRERRLGEGSAASSATDQYLEAARAFELVEPGSDRVVIVDVTPINRTRNFHNFSLETPEFFDDLFLRLTNVEMPESRMRYRVRARPGTEYWVLTRGR